MVLEDRWLAGEHEGLRRFTEAFNDREPLPELLLMGWDEMDNPERSMLLLLLQHYYNYYSSRWDGQSNQILKPFFSCENDRKNE